MDSVAFFDPAVFIMNFKTLSAEIHLFASKCFSFLAKRNNVVRKAVNVLELCLMCFPAITALIELDLFHALQQPVPYICLSKEINSLCAFKRKNNQCNNKGIFKVQKHCTMYIFFLEL